MEMGESNPVQKVLAAVCYRCVRQLVLTRHVPTGRELTRQPICLRPVLTGVGTGRTLSFHRLTPPIRGWLMADGHYLIKRRARIALWLFCAV